MKRFIYWIVIILTIYGSFMLGRITAPVKIKEKIITEEIKTYDLTQKPEIIEAYANATGKTLRSIDERDEYIKKLEMNQPVIWTEGYKEGYKKCRE